MLTLSPNHGTLPLFSHNDDVASIGKLNGDGGLLCKLVDSDVYGCVKLMVEGKQGYVTRARDPLPTVARSILDLHATK